ncbi:hypothetical protein J1605_013446, partial [Eschrichtius robustus]
AAGEAPSDPRCAPLAARPRQGRLGRRGPGDVGERHGRVPGEPVCGRGDGAPPAQWPACPRPAPRSKAHAGAGGPAAEAATVPAHAHPRRQAPAAGGPAVEDIVSAGHPQPLPRALRPREPPCAHAGLLTSWPGCCKAGEPPLVGTPGCSRAEL